jgi:hypothetical protein
MLWSGLTQDLRASVELDEVEEMAIEANRPFVPTSLVLQADNAFAAARGGRQQLQRLRADLLGDADTASWYARRSGRSAVALPRSPRPGAQVEGMWVDPNDEPELIQQLESIVRKLDALEQDRHGIPYDLHARFASRPPLRIVPHWLAPSRACLVLQGGSNLAYPRHAQAGSAVGVVTHALG